MERDVIVPRETNSDYRRNINLVLSKEPPPTQGHHHKSPLWPEDGSIISCFSEANSSVGNTGRKCQVATQI